MDEGGGVKKWVKGVNQEGNGDERGSDVDPDPQKIFFIRIRQNYAGSLDPDPQH